MKINFDANSLHQSRSGMITGIAFVTTRDGSHFPCDGWSDFVVILANWWLDAMNRLKSAEDVIRLQFMDGPYWIEVVANGNHVKISFVDDHSPRTYVNSYDFDRGCLAAEIASFSKDVWEGCKERSFESGDVLKLRTNLSVHG